MSEVAYVWITVLVVVIILALTVKRVNAELKTTNDASDANDVICIGLVGMFCVGFVAFMTFMFIMTTGYRNYRTVLKTYDLGSMSASGFSFGAKYENGHLSKVKFVVTDNTEKLSVLTNDEKNVVEFDYFPGAIQTSKHGGYGIYQYCAEYEGKLIKRKSIIKRYNCSSERWYAVVPAGAMEVPYGE